MRPRALLGILRMQFQAKLQYRTGFWMRISTNFFWGIVMSVIITVFYRYGAASNPAMGMRQAVSYIWLVQIGMQLVPGFGYDPMVTELMQRGDVGIELCRPLNLYWHWYARNLGARVMAMLMCLAPIAAGAMLLPEGLRMMPPASAAGLLACIASLAVAALLGGAAVNLSYALDMQVFVGGYGSLSIILNTVMQIFSGTTLPLQLWLDGWQTVLRYQPFAGMLDLPLRFYLGTAAVSELPRTLVLQLAWTAALCGLGYAWMRRNLKRMVMQGG